LHYYQFNIGDYIKHTLHLSIEEDLCYRRLLDLYYDTEKPIPTDIPRVSRRLRMASEIVQSVLDEFFELTSEGYRNLRADAEIEDYHKYIEKQKANGKLGGRPKKTHRFPTVNPDETQTEPKKSLNTNHKPITNNQEPIKNNTRLKALSRPPDVQQSVWDDFCQHRKAQRAAITQTAIDGIEREAKKAGWTLEAALSECVLRGWRGFKADWVQSGGKSNINRQEALEARNKAIGDAWLAQESEIES